MSGFEPGSLHNDGVKPRFAGSHLVTLAAVAVLLSACGSAEDVANATSETTEATSPATSATEPTTTSEPSTSEPTTSEPSTSEPTKTKEPTAEVAPRPQVGNCYATGRKGFANQRDC